MVLRGLFAGRGVDWFAVSVLFGLAGWRCDCTTGCCCGTTGCEVFFFGRLISPVSTALRRTAMTRGSACESIVVAVWGPANASILSEPTSRIGVERLSVICSYAASFGVMMIERVVMVTVHGMRPETVILFAETMVLSELTVAGCGSCGSRGLAVLCCWRRCCGVRELDAITD